jgi:DNA-binding beta-propeller fold protein YncE
VRSLLVAVVASSLAGTCSLAACATDEPRVEHVFDPYVGPAPYPNVRPKLALPDGDFAFVPSSGTDRIALLDLTRSNVVGSAPIGRDPVTIDGPHQVVVDRARNVGYTVLSYPGAASNAGQHSHGSSSVAGWVQVFALDDLRAIGELRVDPNPGEIAVSDDGLRLVVTHFDLTAAAQVDVPIEQRRATLAVVDPRTILPFGTPEPDKLLVCVAPHGVTLSRPDGAKAFVACYGEDSVAVVDLVDTSAPVVRVPVAAGVESGHAGAPAFGPYAVALSPSGGRLAVSDRDAKDVRFLDVAGVAMEALVVPLLGAPYFAAWSADGTRLFVPTRGIDALVLVDPATGAALRTKVFDAATCAQPLEAIAGVDPSIVFVVCEGGADAPGSVVTLDATTLDVKARLAVGTSPGRSFVGRGR